MKRKLLCLLLCISMILPNVPIAVHADEAATCEHMEVSEDGTVSGNGVCEICAANEKVDTEEKEETDQKEDGNVQSEEKKDSEQSENEKIVSIENEDGGKSDTQETKKQQDYENGQTSQENTKQVSGNAVEEEKDSTISSNNKLLSTKADGIVDGDKIERITYIPELDLPSNEELFAGYAEKILYGYSISAFRSSAGNRLSESEKALYDYLKEQIEKVAAGTTPSTQFTMQDTDKLSKWLEGNSFATEDELKQKLNSLLQSVTSALLSDCVYELYWFDKTEGTGMNLSYSSNDGKNITVTLLKISFSVAKEYQGSGYNKDTPTVDTNKTGGASAAKTKALEVVADNSAKTDYEKLIAYRDYICTQVSYNNNAASNDYTGGYGDPWQLIYVFDGDQNTNVVCEGYAKAFMYLCDLTTWQDSSLSCYLATGVMDGGTGAGEHMWNIVTMGNQNYLVDVTNSDASSVGAAVLGASSPLFLVGNSTGSIASGYSFAIGSQVISYTYDQDTRDMWGEDDGSILKLATGNVGNNVQSEVDTWDEFLAALADPSISKITLTGDITSPQGEKDDPFLITRDVTIYGTDNRHQITLNNGGIILGGNVKFEQITLNFINYIRNVIIANGYSLTMSEVSQGSSQTIHMFCGTITGYSGNIPNAGNSGKIIFEGNNQLGDVYAGSFAEPNQIDKGNNTYISDPGTSNEWTKPSTITVSSGATYSGQIYGHGAWEKRDGSDPWGVVADSTSYKVTGDVTINLTNGSLVVDAATGGSNNATVNYVAAKGDLALHTLKNVGKLALDGTDPKLQPAAGSTIDVTAGISLPENTELNIINLMNTTATNQFTIGKLNGGGKLVFGENQRVTITGEVTKTTKVEIEGAVSTDTTYITATSSQENSFTLEKEGYKFSKKDNGEWLAVLDVKVIPDRYSITDTVHEISLDRFKAEGIEIKVDYSIKEGEYLSDIPMNITVQKEGGGPVAPQIYYNDGYTYGIDDFGIDIFHDEFTKNLVIQEETTSNNLKAGVYTINLSVDTMSGTQSFQIKLTVTDDAQTSVPDAIFNPLDTNDKGWYAGLKLRAPDGYTISKTENGNYSNEIEVEDGEYSNYNYWLKDTQGKPVKKTITELKVDGTSPDITKVEVSEVTATTAKVTVEARDSLSGLNEQSYSLHLNNPSQNSNVTVGNFTGNVSGGYFVISGMTADQSYTFELIVEDNAGSEISRDNIEITPGKTNISTGQLKLNSGISYIYGENGNGGYGWEPKSGQLLLSLNGQTIPLNDTDFEYTYSNNINAGDSAQVTVTVKDSHGTYAGSVTGTFTIGRRPITITPKPQIIRNGNQIQMGVNQVQSSNLVTGHKLVFINLTQDNTNKVVTASTARVTDKNDIDVTENYDIKYEAGSLTILNPVITITPKSDIIYDGNSITIGSSGTQNDVTYTLKDCSTPVIKWYTSNASGTKGQELPSKPKDAGNYIVEISATVDNNLGTEITEKQVTIKKATLTATVENKSLTYGESFTTIKDNAISYSGFVNQETASVISGTPKYSSNYTTFGKVGNYTINADMDNVVAANYGFEVVSGSLDVKRREVTLTWNNYQNRTYGDGNSVTATISNLVNDDKVTVVVSGADATEVGTHTATATGLRGEKAANYTLSTGTTQNYTIAKATAPTNVTAQRNVKWSKGGTETFAVKDFSLPVNVKNPKITKVTKNMGETVDDQGIFANNFQVVNGQVSLSLNKPSIYKEGQKGVFDVVITSDTHQDIVAKLTINVTDKEIVDDKVSITVNNITYGQTPEIKGSFSGTKGSNVTENYKYSTDGITYQTLDSLKNASGFLPVGDYSVQYSYTDDEQIGTKTEAFRVEKKELNISFDVEAVIKEYDGTTSVPSDKLPTLIIKEAVGSEQPKLVNTGVRFTYDSIQAGEGKTIQVEGLTLDTSSAVNDNYTLPGTVSAVGAIITPKKATVLPKTAYTKQYGEKDPVLEYKVTGLIGQDTLEGVLKRAAGENVGSYSYDISGLKNQNYKVELDASSSKFDITKAEAQLTLETDLVAQKAGGKVTLTASAKSKKELEVSGAAQPTAAELAGVSFTEKEAGVFEGIYTIPENAKVGDKIIVTVSLKDANYEEVTAKTVIQVIEEELKPLPTPQEKPETEGDKKPSYKLAMEKGISKVPDGLKKLGHLDTVEEIKDALKLEIKKLHSEITDATSAIYDVTLWYHPGDDDSVWQKADKSHWPKSGKITVVLPYPEGTGKNTHNFKVTHMFTVEMNNNKPGTFEYPTVTKTEEGISFQVSGLSPITLGWTKIQEAPAPNPGSGNSTGGSSDSSEDSSSATTTTVIKRQDVKREEAKATDTTAVAVAQEPAKQKNTKVTVKKKEKEVADNNVVSEKPEATQQTEDAVKEITEEVQEIEGIEEASKVPQDTTQKVQEETKSSFVLWIAAIVALAAAGVVFFILWKNKKNEEA